MRSRTSCGIASCAAVDDALTRLRAYLEQRREVGEREFLLDRLSVDEAMALVAGEAARRAGRGGARPMPREASDAPPAQDRGPERAAPTREQLAPRVREVASSGPEDWRAAFRAAGIAPTAVPTPPSVSPARPTPSEVPDGHLADGDDGARVPGDPSAAVLPIVIGGRTPAGAGGPVAAATSLGALEALIAGCRACSLADEALNPVPGEGNPNAALVIVGEAPGATEDETGRPFVGRSGDLLNDILAAIQLRREDVFICNVVKHRPPKNRNPAPGEIAACRPFLLRQLELLRPRVILTLGAFAARTLLDTKLEISKLRGMEHTYYGVPLVVTYHPAALLRNPAWKRPTWEDVKFVRRLLDRAGPDA